MAQEAVRNVRSHGDATEVEITVQLSSRDVVLTITDNGRGFLPEAVSASRPPGHFGLQLMRDLVDHAGGELAVSSAPGAGTSIQTTVPRQ